jgi:hypothetical protein
MRPSYLRMSTFCRIEFLLHILSFMFVEGKYYEMSSFGESKTMKWLEDPVSARSLVKYNSKQLSRYQYGMGTYSVFRIRIDFWLSWDPYWECGSGSRSKEIDKNKQINL